MSTSTPTTRTDADGVIRYELGNDFVTKDEYDEYSAAETEALGEPWPEPPASQ